jgi:asparagine synthase (glutamine-hydrolysing)
VYDGFDAPLRSTLYTGDFRDMVRHADPLAAFRRAYDACGSADPLDRALYVDVKTYLVDDIMTKVDRMSMAVSLEAREPLLDHRLLEFVASIPSALKLKDGRSKYLLRRLLERRVPTSIVNRPKHGFTAPIAEWLRGPLESLVDGLLTDGRLRQRGIVDERAVKRLWSEHRRKARDHQHRLWSLVMLELWFRNFVDGSITHRRALAPGCRAARTRSPDSATRSAPRPRGYSFGSSRTSRAPTTIDARIGAASHHLRRLNTLR